MRCSWNKCNEYIDDGVPYKLVAVDKPYFNVFFHLPCFNELMKEVGTWEGIELYLAKNLEMWYNRDEKLTKRRRKRRRRY